MKEKVLKMKNKINNEYQLAQDNFTKAQEYGFESLYHAKNCGDFLIKAKNQCQDGEWLNWLSENTEIPPEVAQTFMKVASNWAVIAENATNKNINFGINDAPELLSSKSKEVIESDLASKKAIGCKRKKKKEKRKNRRRIFLMAITFLSK